MGKVLNFENNKEDIEMSAEDARLLIEKEEQLKLCLRIMNGLSLNDTDEEYVKDEDIDYLELWNQISNNKKVSVGEVTGSAIAFYFNLLSTGYDNFGAMFFKHMAEGPNAPYLYYAIVCFMEYMTSLSDESNEK